MKRIFILIILAFLLSSCSFDEDTIQIIENVVDIANEISTDINCDLLDEGNNIKVDASDTILNENELEESSSSDVYEIQRNKIDNSQYELSQNTDKLPKEGTYNSVDDVALYIHQYDKLPKNYITKNEARDLGWSGGSLEKYAPGMSIGGDAFGNYENFLPEKPGRIYRECDIDTHGKNSRGAKRIVYSNDGLIYYTDDHYESFVQLFDSQGKVA